MRLSSACRIGWAKRPATPRAMIGSSQAIGATFFVSSANIRGAMSAESIAIKRHRAAWTAAQARRNRLVGQRFGMLTVLRRYAGTYWDCRCDCGNETTVFGGALTSGRTKSCGHKRKLPPRTAAHRAALSAAGLGKKKCLRTAEHVANHKAALMANRNSRKRVA